MTVRWTKPTNTGNLLITDYFVDSSVDNGVTWTPIADVAPPNEAATIPNLMPGTYVFRVRAANELGVGASSAASAPLVLSATQPAVPAMGSITAGNAQATVNWTLASDGGSTITGFAIQQSQDGGATWQTATLAGTLTGSSRSATVTGLTNGFAYSFRASATNAVGTSAFSLASVPVTPLVPQTSPVSWDLDGDGVFTPAPGSVAHPSAKYVVDFASNDLPAPVGLTAAPVPGGVVLTWSQPIAAGKPGVIDYVVEWSVDGNSWTRFDDGTSTSTTATVTGLAGGQSYYFRVAAANVNGRSTRYATATATAGLIVQAPAQVTGVIATMDGATLNMSWSEPTDNGSSITGYVVRASSDGGQTFPHAVSVPMGQRTFSSPLPSNGIGFVFDVAAVNAIGTGPRSALTRELFGVASVIPAGPVNLVAQNVAGKPGSASLSWAQPVDASLVKDYIVEFRRVDTAPMGEWTRFADGTSTSLTATVSGLAANGAYVFRVGAVGLAAGEEAWQFTTADQVTIIPVDVLPGKATGVRVRSGDVDGQVFVSWDPPAATGGSAVTSYQLSFSTDGVNWNNGGPVIGTGVAVIGLDSSAPYAFRVAATNLAGTGTWSSPSATVFPQVNTNGMQFVRVSDVGNDAAATGYGKVDYEYRIGRHEVTIGQYVEFLNAVAKADPNGLYNTAMGTDNRVWGIIRSGTSGSYLYAAIVDTSGAAGGLFAGPSDNRPVTFIGWDDALRFANWMSNGKPTGPQSAMTTENGAYDMSSTAVAPTTRNAVNPNTGKAPTFFLPTENEWFKAAYYKGGGTKAGYWNYATRSDSPIGFLTNTAVTQAVGSYGSYPSPYGTFDQSGNAWELMVSATSAPYARGGGAGGYYSSTYYASTFRDYHLGNVPGMGFRLATPAIMAPTVASDPTAAIEASLFRAPTSVRVSRVDDGGAAIVAWDAPPALSGFARRGYLLQWSSNGGGTWTSVDTPLDSLATSSTVAGLDAAKAYVFRVAATSDAGTGAFSEPTAEFTAGALPAAPTPLSPTPGPGRVTVRWAAPPTGQVVSDYVVEVSSDSGITWNEQPNRGDATTREVTITNLTPNQPHWFRVRAVNMTGKGAASAQVTATPTAIAPAAPLNVKAEPSNVGATVDWTFGSTGGSPITNLTLEQSSDGGATWQAVTLAAPVATTIPRASVTGLVNGKAYTFRVTTTNAFGTSTASAPSSPVTPRPDVPLATGRIRDDGLVELAAGIKVGNDTSTVTVFVNPVAPSFTAPPSLPAGVTAIEGLSTTIALGAFTGPDGDGTSPDGSQWTVDVRWWPTPGPRPTTFDVSNSKPSFTTARGTIPAQSLTFPRKGDYTVEVTVTDNDGQTAVRTVDVTVGAGTPQAAIGRIVSGAFQLLTGAVTITETESLALEGLATKEGFAGVAPKEYSWKARKAGTTSTLNEGFGRQFTFTPNDGGSYEIDFAARDENDVWTTITTRTVTVTHVKPQVAILGVPQTGVTVSQGSTISLEASIAVAKAGDSVADDKITWSVSGPGGFSKSGTGKVFSFTPSRPGSYQITLEAKDDDFPASAAGSATATIMVANVVPVIPGDGITVTLPAGAATATEGKPITLKARAIDAQTVEGDTLTYTWTKVTRNGVDYPLASLPFVDDTLTFTPDDDGVYVATVIVNDGHTPEASRPTATATVTVANAAPTGVLASRLKDKVVNQDEDDTSVDQGRRMTFRVIHGGSTEVAGATDASSADVAAGLRYSFDLDDDGVWEVLDSALSTFTPPAFSASGPRTIRARVADKDGGEWSSVRAFTVENVAPALKTFGRQGGATSQSLGPITASGSAIVQAKPGLIALSGTFVDPGFASETYRGTCTIERIDAEGTDAVTVPLMVAADGTFRTFYSLPTAGTYRVTATVLDSLGATSETATLTMQVVDIALSNATVAENAGSGAVVGGLSLPGADVSTSFALVTGDGDDDNALFDIVGTSLTARSSFNFESRRTYVVRIGAVGLTVGTLEKVFTISVTDVNEAPTGIRLTDTVTSLPESIGTALRIRLADISVTDDALGTATLSLTGPDAASFEIVGASLYLKAGTSLNAGTKASYAVTVQAADATLPGSAPATSAFALTIVSTANQGPTGVTFANAVTNLAESASTATRTKLADIVVADDGRGTNAITLGGPDAGSFEIVGTALSLKAGVVLNFEAKTSYAVTVSASDSSVAGSVPATATFTLAITNANEAPTDLTLTPASVAENAPIGSPVGVLSPIDPDAGDTFTYALVSGTGSADNAWFELAGSALRTKAVFDYETRSSYSIRVRVTDAGGLSFEKSLTIAITNVNEPPTAVALSLPDSTPTATSVKLADIAVIDDGLGSNLLTLSGADAGSFQIIGTALYLKAGTSLNAQAKPTYVVAVSVADPALPGSLPATTTYTLTILPTGIVVDDGATVVDSVERSGTYQLVKRGDGTLILDKANSHSGGTVVESGVVIVRNAEALGTGALVVKSGATVVVDSTVGTLGVGTLTLEDGGRVDLGTSRLVVAGGLTADSVLALLSLAQGDGAWTETAGLGSNAVTAAVARGELRTIGWLDNGDGSFMVGYAAPGDTNLDAVLDVLDVANLFMSEKFYVATATDASWADGDFNYDRRADVLDIADFFSVGLFNGRPYIGGSAIVSASSASAEQPTSTAAGAVTSANDLAFAFLASGQDDRSTKKRKAFAQFP